MKANGVRQSKKRMSRLRGKLRQKVTNGPYYYRLMVANGVRKEFSLKTSDFDEACRKAADLDAVWEAPTKEVAIAQISAMRGFSKQAMNLPLSQAWDKYQVHPDRATPHTVSEWMSYKATYEEFVRFVTNPGSDRKKRHRVITSITEVTAEVAEEFAAHLKTRSLAVDTHNRNASGTISSEIIRFGRNRFCEASGRNRTTSSGGSLLPGSRNNSFGTYWPTMCIGS